MSRSVELTDEDFARLERAAEVEGITPAEWVARCIPRSTNPLPCTNGKPARTMADVLAGRVGLFDSGGDGMLSERHSELFGNYLEEKRKAGRL